MHDKVLAMIRETRLHENTVAGVAFDPATGEVSLDLRQPGDAGEDFEDALRLTFAGVRRFVTPLLKSISRPPTRAIRWMRASSASRSCNAR